jgi:hypothetical protein
MEKHERNPERTLLGAQLALRHAVAQLEREAARAIWDAPADRRSDIIKIIMQAIAALLAELRGLHGGGGQGPDCPPGFHEEFEICVPNPRAD